MNATKERQAWYCLQVKLCDPCLSALCVHWCKKALYKYSSFPFSFPIRFIHIIAAATAERHGGFLVADHVQHRTESKVGESVSNVKAERTGHVHDVRSTDRPEPVGHSTRVSAAMLASDVIKHDDPAVVVRRKSPVVLVPAYFRSRSAARSARQSRSAAWRQFYVPVARLGRHAMYETRRLCNTLAEISCVNGNIFTFRVRRRP